VVELARADLNQCSRSCNTLVNIAYTVHNEAISVSTVHARIQLEKTRTSVCLPSLKLQSTGVIVAHISIHCQLSHNLP